MKQCGNETLQLRSGQAMKQCNNETMKNGFTLIELLVTVSIIMLMLAIGLPYFRDFEKRGQLDEAAQIVKDGILEAKALSLAPAQGKQEGADAYAVSFTANQDEFEISECKPALGGTDCTYNSKTKNLPAGVEISSVTGDSAIIAFSITEPEKIFLVSGSGNWITITLTHTLMSSSEEREIMINTQTGLVEIR